MDPRIIFEDRDLLVLDKPAGMIVNKADTTKDSITVQDFVEKYLKITNPKLQIPNKSKISNSNDQSSFEFRNSDFEFARRAGIVHRLDKETSGIILVAKTLEAFTNLQSQFRDRRVQKTYIALAHGKIEPEMGEINVSVGRLPWNRKRFGVLSGGRESVTKYKVLHNVILPCVARGYAGGTRPHAEGSHEILRSAQNDIKNENLTLLELYPKSGRTHQIRVHLQYIRHPIFADPLYAGRKTSRNDRKLLSRVFLHAAKISFYHPKTSEIVSFETSLPADLSVFLDSLKA